MSNFAITGVAGYVAPKHLEAIYETKNNLSAALDLHDSVGILDKYFPDCKFFTEPERFDRHLEKLKRTFNPVHYVTICSPNYLHDAHCRLALRVGADAICEKPLVINPWNLNQLKELEIEYKKKIYVVLQLRLDKNLQEIKKDVTNQHKVNIKYITPRGKWYLSSWKGNIEKSGGLLTNIGIHLFDIMIWLFGSCESFKITEYQPERVVGTVWLQKAVVNFFLSIDKNDCNYAEPFRSITIDGSELEFGKNFTNLHTEIYKDILNGGGFGIDDARPAINLTYLMRNSEKCKYILLV
jgi:UDP-N-acetyl-2-amino-2-deoxyglucuronate dehydrogenase